MLSPVLIYFAFMSESIKVALGSIALLTFMWGALQTINSYDNGRSTTGGKIKVILAIVVFFISMALPNQKTLLALSLNSVATKDNLIKTMEYIDNRVDEIIYMIKDK